MTRALAKPSSSCSRLDSLQRSTTSEFLLRHFSSCNTAGPRTSLGPHLSPRTFLPATWMHTNDCKGTGSKACVSVIILEMAGEFTIIE